MLSNLLFSLNTCLPIFFLMGLGFLLRSKGIFDEAYVDRSSWLVFHILLPGKLFLDIAQTDIHAAFEGRYTTAVLIGAMVQFVLAWLWGNLLCRDRARQSAFSHACFRGNFAYVGLALMQNIYGEAIPETTVITAVVLMLYNIQGTVLMTVKESHGGVDVKGILLSLAKNPMVLAIVAAVPFAWLEVQLPFVVTKSLGYLQVSAGPLALLVVGAGIRLSAVRSDMPLLLKISAVKLVIQPLMWVALCLAMGLTHRQMVTAVVAGGMPTAVNTYIITKRMGGDGDLASGAVVISHLLSMVTMTAMIFLMKTAGWI
ncbi:MAG: AEC family transporter [Ruminococcaceae bacterium]|nr:AEC family transporter [Oscillospiraceae bacterium]